MEKISLRIKGVVTAALLACTLQPAVVHAGPSPDPTVDSVSPQLITAMKRDFGLTEEQVRTRLLFENQAARIEAALRAEENAWFGGAWLSTDATRMYIATTDKAAADRIRKSGAEPVIVTYSENDLLRTQARISKIVDSSVRVIYTDVFSNAVIVQAQPKAVEDVRALLKANGVDLNAVQVVASSETPVPLIDVVGGNRYDNSTGWCSIGFAVSGGFVTAGHCGRSGERTSSPSGTFRGSSFPGNDYAWVQVSVGNTPIGNVNNYSGGMIAVAGSQEATVGSSVCRSGARTGFHCGTIHARETSVQYKQGWVFGLIRTDVCAESGDSGGALLSGNQAQGVTSGGSGDCKSGGTTYFQPVNEILSAYQLTLLTPGAPPITDHSPFGWLDVVNSYSTGEIWVAGWAIDPDMVPPTGPIEVDISLDGSAPGRYIAQDNRPDVGAAYPQYGPYHGFGPVIGASPGQHTVCVSARNYRPPGAGNTAPSTSLGCQTVTVDIPPSGPTGPIVSVYAGKCVDVAGGNPADTTPVQLFDCNGTDAQRWTLVADGTIRALGKCLDVSGGGTSNGTLVWLFTCNGTGAQVWERQLDGSLRNPQSGRCLDDLGFNTANGAALGIWDCNGLSNQKWTLPAP